MEEARAGAAVRLGDLDAHDAQAEQVVDEVAGHLRVLVHLPDQRANALIGEFEDAVAKELFVFREDGERRAADDRFLRHGHVSFCERP